MYVKTTPSIVDSIVSDCQLTRLGDETACKVPATGCIVMLRLVIDS